MFTRAIKFIKQVWVSRILRSSSLIVIGTGMSMFSGLALSILLARNLGAENSGLIALAIASISVVVGFIDVRSDSAIVKLMKESLAHDNHQEAITYFYLGFAIDAVIMLITFIIIVVGLPVFASVYSRHPTLPALMGIYMLTVPFALLDNIFLTVLVVFKRFTMKAASIIGASLVLLISVGTQSMTNNVITTMWGYLVAAVFIAVLQVGLGVYVLQSEMATLAGANFKRCWQRLLPFIFHTNLAGYFKTIASNLDILVLGMFRPAGDVAFYKIARSALPLVSVPINPVVDVAYPNLVEAFAKADLKRAKSLIGKLVLYTISVSAGIVLLLFLTAEWVVVIIYGIDFAPTVGLLRILLGGSILANIAGLAEPVALARGKPEYNTYLKALMTLSRTVLVISLTFMYGATGASLAFTANAFLAVLFIVLVMFPKLGIWTLHFGKARQIEEPG